MTVFSSLRSHLLRAAVVCTLLFALCTGAFAQLDPGDYVIYQNGRIVGEIYVPARDAKATLYTEHWVLSPDYQYPNARNQVKMEITPAVGQMYSSERDFFNRVRFTPGSRYVQVISNDTAQLPTGR